jgi:hypothetical protein
VAKTLPWITRSALRNRSSSASSAVLSVHLGDFGLQGFGLGRGKLSDIAHGHVLAIEPAVAEKDRAISRLKFGRSDQITG